MRSVDAPGRRSTLRRRLLIRLGLPLCGILCLAVYTNYRATIATVDVAFDHSLGDDALALAARVSVGPAGTIELDLPAAAEQILRTDSDDREFFTVWGPDGRRIAGDDGLDRPPWAATAMPVMSDGRLKAEPVRRADYGFMLEGRPIHVAFAETLTKRNRVASEVFLAMLVPNVLLVSTSLIIVWLGVGAGLEPLRRLGQRIAQRGADDLRPLPADDVPGEADPLVEAIDRLMDRLRVAAEAQRRFLADAAHQIRTPLTGLQTQLDLALDDAPDALRPRVLRALQSVRRLERVGHQLLVLARAGPDAISRDEWRALDLEEVIADGASSWHDGAEAAGVELSFETAPAPVRASEWILGEVVGNLIDNAVKHGGSPGRVIVRCGEGTGGGAWLEVLDEGPGIPECARGIVFERFQRGPNPRAEGSGLGLSIAAEACRQMGAVLEIADNPPSGGCRIHVTFPAVG